MVDIPSALHVLRPGASWSLDNDVYAGLNWFDTVQSKPTEQEVNDEIARQQYQESFGTCKAKAKTLLSETDWVELPSVGDASNALYVVNVAELVAYRNQVRELAVNPVANPVWPAKPETQWNK